MKSSTVSTTPPVLALSGIRKTFGGIAALQGVNLDLHGGEVVGLVGDNGAGKSTLIKTIGGVYRPDEGEVIVDGESRDHFTPALAQKHGIETIHQHLGLVDSLDVAANIFINRERVRANWLAARAGWLDQKRMYAESAKALAAFGLPETILRKPVRQLSGGQRQMVAIARALHWQPRMIMMDEPTAALAVEHAGRVLDLIRSLADSGIAVLLVSHDMQHVLQVTHRVVVLRQGRKVADLPTADTSHQEIVMYITGHVQQTLPEVSS